MKIIGPSFEILGEVSGDEILKRIESIGRVCYKSEDKITSVSAGQFIGRIIKSGHESVIEHVSLSVRVICDRGVSHEIVRHRLASYSQESTRYCNYSQEKFGNEITLIKPCFWNEGDKEYDVWCQTMQNIEDAYNELIKHGAKAEQARSILPNSLKTEIVMTMNLREWRHFFKLRTAKAAHPQIREICIPLLERFKQLVPAIFSDIISE